MPSVRLAPTALGILALLVLAAAALVTMSISLRQLRADRERRLLAGAEALAASLADLDPYFVDPTESATALLRIRRLTGALGLHEASVIELGDSVLVTTSPVTPPGGAEPSALAAPESAAAAWMGEPSLSPVFVNEAASFQAAFVPLRDEEGSVATLLVATAGRRDFETLDLVDRTFQLVVYGSAFSLVLLLVAAWAVRGRAERAEADLEHTRRLSVAGQVAAGVVHEVRNPLGIMRSTIEYLRDRSKVEGSDRELFDEALEEADRISEILERFLSLAREAPSEPIRVELAGALEGVARLAEKDLSRRGLTLVVEAPPGLAVSCDPRSLRQALLNLVLNAREALEGSGRPQGSIRLAAQAAPGPRVRIQVEDDGPGFPESVLAEPFRAFRTTRPDGTGLGLALVRRMVRGAGGEASLGNRPGGGATVVLEFPAAPEEEAVDG